MIQHTDLTELFKLLEPNGECIKSTSVRLQCKIEWAIMNNKGGIQLKTTRSVDLISEKVIILF